MTISPKRQTSTRRPFEFKRAERASQAVRRPSKRRSRKETRAILNRTKYFFESPPGGICRTRLFHLTGAFVLFGLASKRREEQGLKCFATSDAPKVLTHSESAIYADQPQFSRSSFSRSSFSRSQVFVFQVVVLQTPIVVHASHRGILLASLKWSGTQPLLRERL